MILLDSSVWIQHLRRPFPDVDAMLEEGRVLGHPIVRGELAMGNLKNRNEFLHRMGRLPQAARTTDAEVLAMVERHALHGLGIGYGDACLLSAALMGDAKLWSLDRRLSAAAERLGVAA